MPTFVHAKGNNIHNQQEQPGSYMEDYYEILGISSDADKATITSAYRRLALQYHPDKNKEDPSAASRFAKIGEVYRLLLDQTARDAFDRVRKIRISVKQRQAHLDDRRRALREELLSREDESRRQKEEAERLEAERKLQYEVARVQAETELRKREELQRRGIKSYTEEECTLKYTLFDKKLDMRTLYPQCKIVQKLNNSFEGILIFPDLPSARNAMNKTTNGLVLEWLHQAGNNSEPRNQKTIYESWSEEELEKRTLERLLQLDKASKPLS
jgi:curved DNA-binding protein CbpA